MFNTRSLLDQESLKPKKTSETLGRLAGYFKPFWYAMLLAATFITVSTWAQVTTPEITGQIVDCYLTPAVANTFGAPEGMMDDASQASQSNCWLAGDTEATTTTQRIIKSAFGWANFSTPADPANPTNAERITGLGQLITVLIVLFVLGSLLTGLTFFTMSWAGQHVLRDLRAELFSHMHTLPIGFYAESEVGDLMSRITNDSDTIQQALSFALVNVVSGALLLVWIAYNMLTKNVPFALLSMAIAPFMAIVTLWFSEQARKAFRKTRLEMGSVNANLQESISAVRESQAFNRAEENIEHFRSTNAANRDANVRAVAYTSALAPALEALSYLALAVVTVVGGLALLNGSSLGGTVVSIGLVITFLGYVQRFNQPIQQIAVLWSNIQSAVAGAERIFGLLDEVPGIQDKPGAGTMGAIEGKVELDNVSAEYKAGEPVLRNVNFYANPGQTVAIVGPTGAGKTTIINLIPRFYDVTGGSVRIDGVDVREVTQESLRQQIGIVLQDTFLFSTTVMDNIRFGRPAASDDEVIAAAKLAHADSFIERLPEKYNTVLGERGAGLSQGQRQLLAIARAALADPRILILDEATSSVDTRTERLIQSALEKLLAGRTSFVIAHRLSTIRNADVILVLKAGEIIERGKHAELLEKKGFYYDLYMSQFKKQEEMAGA
ncbi:MAG TPA: ABC transporter ATP-binding protein [Anaerolineales bacterium]|nr:ABC transporter ATP-binding protein [Anaerolineales bacterium]HRQ91518.1 ABC transporter ATP-binding protein [Anaerolineales bacterium]